jgi:nucleotide-binding universal stress UspA family protein
MAAPIRKILVPTDFSADARRAQDLALELARPLGASVVLLHVYQFPAYLFFDGSTYVPPPKVAAQIASDVDAALAAAKDAASSAGVPVETASVQGSPYEDIARYAQDNMVDLIVMGTHGRRGWRRLVAGSVAEHVVRSAHIPVLTVPSPKRD